MNSVDPSVLAAIVGAIIGALLIILNEWVKAYFEQKKQKKKLKIWAALEQTGSVPCLLSKEDLSIVTGLSGRNITPLIYEMLQEGTVSEGSRPGTFTRYKDKVSHA